MKKLHFLIVAILCVFLISGCASVQHASDNVDEPKPSDQIPEATTAPQSFGLALVYGKPEAKTGEKIYSESYRKFPLDAAVMLDYITDNSTVFVGAQNIASSHHHIIDTDERKNTAEARYNSAVQGDFTLYAYDVQYDGARAWFDPSDPLVVYTCSGNGLISVAKPGTNWVSEISFAGAVPMASLTVTCRDGEKELSTQTLQAAEMDVNMTYQVPDGTDNVKVVSFDAEGNIIEQEILKSGNYVYNVWYDIGGFFLGYKALNLKWP